MCCSFSLSMNAGERRDIFHTVWLETGAAFTVQDATWQLLKGGIEKAHGEADAEEVEGNKWKLSALIQPDSTGYYELIFTYSIGEEIFKPSAVITVN